MLGYFIIKFKNEYIIQEKGIKITLFNETIKQGAINKFPN